MSEQTLRDATIDFVSELCEQVGPFTFAGQGGRIAMLRHQIHQASGENLVAGVFNADARVQEVMRAWVDSAPLPALIGVLLDLVAAPPPEAGHDLEGWQSELMDLLDLCGRRDRSTLDAGLAARVDVPASFVAELQSQLADDELAPIAGDRPGSDRR